MEQPEWGKKLSKCCIVPQRLILSFMGLFGICSAYTMRISLSVAIIVMVVKKEHKEDTHSKEGYCPPDPNAKPGDDDIEGGGEYDWSEEHQGLVLSAFYWGYLLTHLPSGMLADAFGGKWTLAIGVLISSVCCILSPLAVREGGSYFLIALRVLMGGGQGVVYPALSVLISDWVPKKERSTLGAFIMGGGQLGTILGNSISGLLLHSFVWDVTFYVFGFIGLGWSLLFIFLCYNQPNEHPFIKESEKEYLVEQIGVRNRGKDVGTVPWVAMMTNAGMIALIIAQAGHDYGFYIMVSDLPKYMGDVLQFSIKENGLFSALPYLSMWIESMISGVLTDWIIRKEYMTITNARILMTSIAAFGPAVFIVAASYAECDKMLVVALFTIAMGLMGSYYAGLKLTAIDMTPNFAGTAIAVSNGIGAITGILAPYLAGIMTPESSLGEWRNVFWLAFIILVSTCFVFIIWGTGEVQPFNEPKPRKTDS